MRKIEKLAKSAFFEGINFRKSNTSIETVQFSELGKVSKYYLFGNLIAEYQHKTGKLYISNCGWTSNTTKSRLNSILPHNYSIYQEKYIWYFNIWGKAEEFKGEKVIYLNV